MTETTSPQETEAPKPGTVRVSLAENKRWGGHARMVYEGAEYVLYAPIMHETLSSDVSFAREIFTGAVIVGPDVSPIVEDDSQFLDRHRLDMLGMYAADESMNEPMSEVLPFSGRVAKRCTATEDASSRYFFLDAHCT